jgi:hypothetical protein
VEGLLAHMVDAAVTTPKMPLVEEEDQEPQADHLGGSMMMQHLNLQYWQNAACLCASAPPCSA